MATTTATRPRTAAAKTTTRKPATKRAPAKPQTISKADAAVLWDDLRIGLLDVESTVRNIIEKRAWIPLGYASFAQAWAAETKGILLAGALRAEVVYTMMDTGSDDTEIARAIGSTTTVIGTVRENRAQGKPATASVFRKPITTTGDKHYVSGHQRTSRGATDDVPITFRITKAEREAWSEFVPDLAKKAEELLRDYCKRGVVGRVPR